MSRIEKALEKAVRMRESSRSRQSGELPLLHDGTELEAKASIAASPYIVALTDPGSPITEEYRKLKSMIIRLTTKEGFQNTLLVTSAVSGEGKSITSLNLAIILAQEYNHTVLLIDADLRRPSLHTYLGISPATGLTDCLVDGLDPGSVMVKTGIPRLSFLASGKKVKNPAELLASSRMKDFLGEVKHRYRDRYVIIDMPPVLPFAEAHGVSSFVDGAVFVVKEGVTSIASIRDAFDILRDAPVLGIVYNDVRMESLKGRYHYYYDNPYRKHAQSEQKDHV